MGFLNFVMALSPIIVVLVGILGFRQSARRVAPVALIWTLVLAFTYFNVTGATFKENVAVYDALLWKGIKEGLKIVLMVFGAFVILNLLRDTGAIDEVKGAIARISDDRRVQVVIIGMMLPIFLEGAAGAGSPAAIAAPFLVALGFDPVTSIALALLGDATPCSWGGAGLTTINGGAALVDAGVDMLTLANNHMLDGWFDGLMAEIANVEKVGLKHVGANRSAEEKNTPVVYEINGIKVGTVIGQKLDNENYDAEVKLSIAPNVKLPKDSAAVIASNGLMGNKFIKIEPGKSKELLQNGDEITNTKDFKTLEDLVGEVIFMVTGNDKQN